MDHKFLALLMATNEMTSRAGAVEPRVSYEFGRNR